MKRRLIIVPIVAAAIFIALVVISSLRTKIAISFSPPEAEMLESTPRTLKVTFYVTNTATRAAFLQVAAVETNSGSAFGC